MRTFSEAMRTEKRGAGSYLWEVTEDWGQGRAAFGGLVAATAVQTMLSEVPEGRTLRTLMTSFVAPVKSGVETRIETEVLRSGKALTHFESKVLQGTEVCTVMMASFGADHEKQLLVEPPARPLVVSPEELGEMPFLEGVLPNFAQHLAYRWSVDTVPYGGAEKAQAQGWCRLRDAERVQIPGVVALLDAWPPPILSRADSFIPASSVTWMINFFSPLPEEGYPADAWWLFDGLCTASMNGYADTAAEFWDPSGRLVARSRQLAVEFS